MTKRATGLATGAAAVAVIAAALLLRHPTITMSSMAGMPNTSASATNTDKVTIESFSFQPMAIHVRVGTTVSWTNMDAVQHSVTADNKSGNAPNSALLSKGQRYSFTFKQSGTYSYHCMPHLDMHGTVIVTN